MYIPQTVGDSAIESELVRLAQTPFICIGPIYYLVLFRIVDWVFFFSLGLVKESQFAHGGPAASFFIVFTQNFQILRPIGAGIEFFIRFLCIIFISFFSVQRFRDDA